MRRAGTSLVSMLVLLAGCGADSSGAVPDVVTVAVLRAVPSENPAPFLDELRAAGFVEGRTLDIVPDAVDETYPDPADARAAVARWVENGADLIVAYSSSGAQAAREAAPDTNILFLVNDPRAVALVEDEERPRGRLTGVTFRVPADRTLALAQQAVTQLTRIGFLVPASDPAGPPHQESVEAAAGELGIEVVVAAFADEAGIEPAVGQLAAAEVDAVFLANTPTSVRALGAIEPAVAARELPLVANVELAETAVVALSPDVDEVQAQMGRQAARLLRGAEPRDVPVEDPRRFRVVVNLTRAGALGLTPLPDTFLRQADEVRR